MELIELCVVFDVLVSKLKILLFPLASGLFSVFYLRVHRLCYCKLKTAQLGEIWIESPIDKIDTSTHCLSVCVRVKEGIIKNNSHELIGIRNFPWRVEKSWEFSLCKCNLVTFQLWISSSYELVEKQKKQQQPVIFPHPCMHWTFSFCYHFNLMRWSKSTSHFHLLLFLFDQFFSAYTFKLWWANEIWWPHLASAMHLRRFFTMTMIKKFA